MLVSAAQAGGCSGLYLPPGRDEATQHLHVFIVYIPPLSLAQLTLPWLL